MIACQTILYKISSKSNSYSFLWTSWQYSQSIHFIETIPVNHNTKLCNLISGISINSFYITVLVFLNFLTQYCAGDKIEKNEMSWVCGTYGWGEGVYRVLVGKPEGRRPLARPRHRWVGNIRMDLQKVGCGYMDWIGLAQDRDRWRTLVSAVMNLRVPWNAGNFLTRCKPVS